MTPTPQGWLNTVTVVAAGGNAVTTIDHDAEGQVTRITSPDGSYLAYTYDGAHRRARGSNAPDEGTPPPPHPPRGGTPPPHPRPGRARPAQPPPPRSHTPRPRA